MKFLCIHQNHLILNYWSGPCFSPHFCHEQGKSKNSLPESVPRSLSMFSQSGSFSEFRWASCSSLSFCVSISCIASHICAAVHTHTQPYRHNTPHTLQHVPAITESNKKTVCPWSFSAVSVSGKPPSNLLCITSQFTYHYQHILCLRCPLPHPVLILPHFGQKHFLFCRQLRSPTAAMENVLVLTVDGPKTLRPHDTNWKVTVSSFYSPCKACRFLS